MRDKTPKFRILHTAQDGSKTLFYPETPGHERFVITLNGDILENYGKSWKDSMWEQVFDGCTVELHKWTGLKDKNGKDIYEYDIVNVQRCHSKEIQLSPTHSTVDLIEDGIELGLVLWLDYAFEFGVSFEHIHYDDVEKLMGNSSRYEVIGNYFQNNELLNE